MPVRNRKQHKRENEQFQFAEKKLRLQLHSVWSLREKLMSSRSLYKKLTFHVPTLMSKLKSNLGSCFSKSILLKHASVAQRLEKYCPSVVLCNYIMDWQCFPLSLELSQHVFYTSLNGLERSSYLLESHKLRTMDLEGEHYVFLQAYIYSMRLFNDYVYARVSAVFRPKESKGRFCNTIASVALAHTSIQSD